jgi:hypothetical protein
MLSFFQVKVIFGVRDEPGFAIGDVALLRLPELCVSLERQTHRAQYPAPPMAATAWLTVSIGEVLCACAAIDAASVASMKLPHKKKSFMKFHPQGARLSGRAENSQAIA